MPATRKDVEESTMGGRGGECDAGGRRVAGAAAAASAYPVADGEERGATSLPTMDSTVHTIYRSPSMGAWMPDSECGGVQQSRYSLLPPPTATNATASIQQMESAAAMMKLAYRNRLHDRMPPGSERRTSTPGGDVTGGSSWRLPAAAWAAHGAAAGAAAAEAPAPLRGDPEVPRPHHLRLPLADVCEASVARQRAPRDPSTSSDEGLGLDRQPSLTDLRSLDSESGGLAAAMPPVVGRRRPRGLHEPPLSGHRIHQSQSPPHDRLDSLRSGRPMSASTTFHGLQSMPGYRGHRGAGNEDAAEGLPPPDGQHDPAGMAPPVDYTMWANKIVELQQMSDSLTQGIAKFIRIASSSDTQYQNAVPPLVTNERRGLIVDNHFSRKSLDSTSPMVSSRTLFSRTAPAVDAERHCATPNAGRDNCITPHLNCTVTPADMAVSADRYEVANSFERGMVTRSLTAPQSGGYLYQDQGSLRGTPRVCVGDATADSPVSVAAISSLRGVGLDQNEALKRQSAEISGDSGGYRPGVVPRSRRQCTGESGDFEPPGPLVNSETTSSVEMGHCSRNCICKEDCQYAARTSTDVYPNDLPTLTLFERADDADTCTESAVGVNVCETEELISTDIRIHESSTTNESPEDSISWMRSVRSETAICSHTSDFVVPDTGLNYTFPPSISGIDEMRAILLKERNVNTGESLANDKCRPQCSERNGDIERPVTDATEPKREEEEQNLNSSNRNANGDTSSEPSYDLDQHFLPTTGMSSEVCETDNNRGVPKINNDAEVERNENESKSVTSSIMRNETVENFKKDHIGYSLIGSNKPSSSNVFRKVREEGAMQNVCISTCALRTLLSGHGILEEVEEMDKLSTTILENKERTAHLNPVRESTSIAPENEAQPRPKENARYDTLNREPCRVAERPAEENDIYAVSGTILGAKPGPSRTGSVADAGLFGRSVTVLASEKDLATSEDRSRSATPTEDYKGGAGDETASNATSASTSLFGGIIHRPGTAPSPSETSSGLELVVPTNSIEDMPALISRRPSSRYDARETLNLVRDLIWKDSTYKTMRPEHDVEAPSTSSCQQAAAAAAVENDRKSAQPAEPQPRAAGRSGVRTVWQPRHHRLRHDRSSQTCVAVREFPNIPATDSLQRTVKTTNLKGPPKSPTVSPRGATSPVAARLHQKTSPAPIRSGPTVPGGWPAVSARPLPRPATHTPAAHAHAHAGQSRSAGSSPRMPCSVYSREPASRGSSGSASPRESASARSKDASAADALLADAASLFRAKLEASDRKQGEQRRPQKGRPMSAAARLSSGASAGPPSTYMRMLRTGASSGRRQPLQDQDNWHQRQQQLQQRQLQLQQRQQQLQQRQLQLQQRQQMQQRQQLLQRQQRMQQAPSWQPRVTHAQIAKPVSRRPAARTGDAAGCSRGALPGPGAASLRMLQARLRAGGSLHHGVVAVAEAREETKAQAELIPADCPTRDDADDGEVEVEVEVEDAAVLEPDTEADTEAEPEGREPVPPDTPPPPVQPPTPEEEPSTPEEESPDTPEADDAGSSTDTTELCRELLDTPDDNSSGFGGANSDTSSLLNADFVNVETRLSDLSLLSERCRPTMRFVNYLPSAPIREIEEEDLFREIMLSGQGDVFRGSYDTSPLPHSANETQQSDSIKPPNREGSDTGLSVQSEHIIEPPAEFCTDVKAGGEDECVLSSQSPTDDIRNQDGYSTASTLPADGLEISHNDDAGMKASCSRCSSCSSIYTRGETDTSRNVTMTSDLDELAETTDMTSASDANRDSCDEDNAMLNASNGISSRESPSIPHSEITLDNHSEGQNNVSEEKSLHEDDPMLICCDLCSIQTTPLAVDETDTAGGFDAEKFSPQHNDFREKCDNDLANAASAETAGNADSNAQKIVCSVTRVDETSLNTADRKEDHGGPGESYIEQQVMDQERVNDTERNEADRNYDQNNLNTLAKPSSTALPIASSVDEICAEATANNDVTHKPSIKENTDVELYEIPTEQSEGDNNVSGSSQCDSLSPTVSSEYTDCSHTSDKSVEGQTEGIGHQKICETNIYNIEQSTSANLPEEQLFSTILSQESSTPQWNTSTDNNGAISSSVEIKTTVQEECSEMIPCAVDVSCPKTAPSLLQDVLIDVPQTEKCLTDASVINVVGKISDNEENSGNIDSVLQDLQDDDSFCDAVDDTISLKSINNDALTDASSISDPFSAAQFYSDGDEGPLSPAVGSNTSCRISDELSYNYVDECLSNLCETLVRSRVESELKENLNEELNKTDVDNNVSSETNGEIISMGTDTTSYANASTAPVPETPSTEAHGTQRTQVVDVVSSATSWVTVSTVSFSESAVEEASVTSLTVCTRNKLENSQEHEQGSSDHPECIASESHSIASSELPVVTNVSSLVTTGANIKAENNAEKVGSFFDNTKSIGDATLDEICAIRSSELTDEESVLCLAAVGTQSNVEIKDQRMERSWDNMSLPESYITPSSELLVETMTSYFALVGAQTILEHVESSSDIVERIRNSTADETCTLRSSEFADEANISSLVVNGTQNKVEINEHVESSADNVESVQDTEKHKSNITDPSELVAGEITSSQEVVGTRNIFEHVENSSENGDCTLDLEEDENYTIHSSELADEAKFRPPVVGGTQNMVEINEEHVDSSSGIAKRSQYAPTHESYPTTSSELQVEGNISSLSTVGNKSKLENILEHVESSLDDAERIRHPTACEMVTSDSDTKSGNQEDADEIPLGEASTSWETLSEHSCLADEDEESADITRASEATTQIHQRRRRFRRESQWRASRAERDPEPERRIYDLVLASPEVEVHLSEALAHSETEQPLMTPGPRLAAVGATGSADTEALVAAALAGVALVDADAEAEGATDILYGTRDLHSAAVEAAVACVVDSELRDLSALYVQRLGGCLLVGGAQPDPQPAASAQTPVPAEDETHSTVDEASCVTPTVSGSTTPPASPAEPNITPSDCSLHGGTVAAGDISAASACPLDGQRSHAIATLLTVCVFLAAYSSCLLLDPNLHLP